MSGQRIERRIVGFVHLLRHNGFALGVEETLDALRVARAVDLERPEALRWGLRALLASTEDEWRRFDELFDLHWRGRGVKQAVRSRGSGAGAFRGRKLGDAPPGAPALADRVTRGDDGDASVGGDLFDIRRLSRDRGLLVVADVSGKGIEAAVNTAFVKYSLRTLALANDDPAAVDEGDPVGVSVVGDAQRCPRLRHRVPEVVEVLLRRLRATAGKRAVRQISGDGFYPTICDQDAEEAARE